MLLRARLPQSEQTKPLLPVDAAVENGFCLQNERPGERRKARLVTATARSERCRPQPESVGGTSAVASLYAGLMPRINENLGHPAGFLNPILYKLPTATFRDIVGALGPAEQLVWPRDRL